MGKLVNWQPTDLRVLVCPRCEKRYYVAFSDGARHCRQCGGQLREQPPAGGVKEKRPAA
jgi:uncharacterized protein (DUF983 family)